MDTIDSQQNAEAAFLHEDPTRYSFFQALREIECSVPDAPRVGSSNTPANESYRLRQPSELTFAPTTIQEAVVDESNRLEISQRFFGLTGPSGPLPEHLTELVRNRARHAGDGALQAFLDLFHHRMAALFYRAWSSSRSAIQFDRPLEDRFAAYLDSFIGLNFSERSSCSSTTDAIRFFAGRLGSIRRNAEGLAAILQALLRTKVVVRPFALSWLKMARSERSQLGGVSIGGRASQAKNVLGSSAVLGESVPDRQSSVEIEVGPVRFPDFQSLLPNQSGRDLAQVAVRAFAGPGMAARIRVVVDKDEIPRPQLGRCGQIGRTVWLQSKRLDQDRNDYSFEVDHEDCSRGGLGSR